MMQTERAKNERGGFVAFLDALDDPIADRPHTANVLISDIAPAFP